MFIIRSAFAAQTFNLIQILHQLCACVSMITISRALVPIKQFTLIASYPTKNICVKRRRKVAKNASDCIERVIMQQPLYTNVATMQSLHSVVHSPHNITDFYFLSTKQKMITLIICARHKLTIRHVCVYLLRLPAQPHLYPTGLLSHGPDHQYQHSTYNTTTVIKLSIFKTCVGIVFIVKRYFATVVYLSTYC